MTDTRREKASNWYYVPALKHTNRWDKKAQEQYEEKIVLEH